MKPASTRPFMNDAWAGHSDCSSIGRDASQSGPERWSTTWNIVTLAVLPAAELDARTAAAVARARPPRCDLGHEDGLLGSADAVLHVHAKRDLKTGTSSFRCEAVDEACAVNVEALALLGRDEAVVLLLVEPEHRSVHRSSFCPPPGVSRLQATSNESGGRGAPPDSRQTITA